MLSPKEKFVIQYYPYAKKASEQSGIPILFALAQSALESGWGKSAKGNMMFGIKKGSGRNYGGWSDRRSQLITTTEYANVSTRKFPYIYPGYPKRTSSGKWKYKIKDTFRAYPTPFHSFMDWAGLLKKNGRYVLALRYTKRPYRFAEEVAKAGYATDPNYAAKVKRLMKEIEHIIILKKLHKRKMSMAPIVLLTISAALVFVMVMKSNPK